MPQERFTYTSGPGQSMTIEKSWMIMKDRTVKEHEEKQEACSTSEMWRAARAVCDLETGVNTGGWRRVTNANDRISGTSPSGCQT